MPEEVADSKKGQVNTELDMIDGALERLQTSVANMESMLGPILRPEEPGKEPEDKKLDELVVIADRCRNIRFAIMNRSKRLEDIMKRIEL